MEQIVYCQDQVYRRALQKVREKEAAEEKSKKPNSHFQPQSLSDPSIAEIFQHLIAYHQVSLRAPQNGTSHLFPFCECLFSVLSL